ncbi:MAG: CAP domain-containing protein [Polyangiaceae bacterium]|nr:CAP domain-containing protein [Polyangiaceae bacterium]MCW5789133.1 CAP domain-containing protein [Polyangiaceae bacterium]
MGRPVRVALRPQVHPPWSSQAPQLAVMALCTACGSTAPLPPDLIPPAEPAASTPSPEPELPPLGQAPGWRREARSPEPETAPDPSTQRYLDACGVGEAPLHRVAARVAEGMLRGDEEPEMAQVTFTLRSQGSPHVWPRVWTLAGSEVDPADATERITRWARASKPEHPLRCGVARVSSHDRQVIALVAVEALADLVSPVPLQPQVGSWISLHAKLLVPAQASKLVLLPPTGAPREVPTNQAAGSARASFQADAKGRWVAQLLVTTSSGPRPLLEVELYAGEPPPSGPDTTPAPGEGAGTGSPEERLFAWVNAARAAHDLPALRSNPTLAELARAHAREMQKAGRLAHDVGQGNPADRIEAARLSPKISGENVARARTLERAHRALWRSPSHRGNLLHPRFTEVGVGVVQDPEGNHWVAELFASF